MPICKSIDKLETCDNVDVLLTMVDDTQAYWFYDYGEALKFVGKEVIVSYRDDFYKGNKVTAINTIVVPTTINVLDKHVALKLYSDAEDNKSNLSFNDIPLGTSKDGCIFYCCSQSRQASARADWLELLIRDKSFRIAKVRLFSPDNIPELEGKYCIATLKRTQYGLQSDMIAPTSTEVAPNPEIDIAEEYISQYFANDQEALSFINNNALIQAMRNYLDYEKGYALVRLAMELCMCEQLYNITKDIDVRTLSHAILVSYGFTATPNLPISKETASVMLTMRARWTNLPLLISIIDPGQLEKPPMERDLLTRIKSMVSAIVDSRKQFRV